MNQSQSSDRYWYCERVGLSSKSSFSGARKLFRSEPGRLLPVPQPRPPLDDIAFNICSAETNTTLNTLNSHVHEVNKRSNLVSSSGQEKSGNILNQMKRGRASCHTSPKQLRRRHQHISTCQQYPPTTPMMDSPSATNHPGSRSTCHSLQNTGTITSHHT